MSPGLSYGREAHTLNSPEVDYPPATSSDLSQTKRPDEPADWSHIALQTSARTDNRTACHATQLEKPLENSCSIAFQLYAQPRSQYMYEPRSAGRRSRGNHH